MSPNYCQVVKETQQFVSGGKGEIHGRVEITLEHIPGGFTSD